MKFEGLLYPVGPQPYLRLYYHWPNLYYHQGYFLVQLILCCLAQNQFGTQAAEQECTDLPPAAWLRLPPVLGMW